MYRAVDRSASAAGRAPPLAGGGGSRRSNAIFRVAHVPQGYGLWIINFLNSRGR